MTKFRDQARCFYYPLPVEVLAVLAECDPDTPHIPEHLQPYVQNYFDEARERLQAESKEMISRFAESDAEGRQCAYMAAMLLHTPSGAVIALAFGTKSGIDITTQVHQSTSMCLYGEVFRCQINH